MFDNLLSGYLTMCGSIALVAGAWLCVGRARLWWWGERTTGEVVRYIARLQSRGGRTSYMPHIRYGVADGRLREFTSTTSADPQTWPVGTHVPVAFAPDDPQRAEIATPLLFWRGPVGVMLFGVALLLAALQVGA
jgi:hypothetical protein